MDLHENSETKSVTVTFELPGLNSEDVAIEVTEIASSFPESQSSRRTMTRTAFQCESARMESSLEAFIFHTESRLRTFKLRWRMVFLRCSSQRLQRTSNQRIAIS